MKNRSNQGRNVLKTEIKKVILILINIVFNIVTNKIIYFIIQYFQQGVFMSFLSELTGTSLLFYTIKEHIKRVHSVTELVSVLCQPFLMTCLTCYGKMQPHIPDEMGLRKSTVSTTRGFFHTVLKHWGLNMEDMRTNIILEIQLCRISQAW